MAVEAVVARTLGAPGVEHRQLAFETDRRATDQRLASGHAGDVDRLAGGKVVTAVEHQVDGGHHGTQGIFIQGLAMGNQADLRVDCRQPAQRRVDLGRTDAVGVVDDLALQVGQVDAVEIRQVQFADTGGGQVQGHRRPQATQADNQYPAVFQAQLAVDIHLLQQDLPAIAQQLLVVQHDMHPRLMRW